MENPKHFQSMIGSLLCYYAAEEVQQVSSALLPRCLPFGGFRRRRRTLGIRRGEQRERSGRCLPSPACPCWAGLALTAASTTHPKGTCTRRKRLRLCPQVLTCAPPVT
jgi:hypothetical protein